MYTKFVNAASECHTIENFILKINCSKTNTKIKQPQNTEVNVDVDVVEVVAPYQTSTQTITRKHDRLIAVTRLHR